jgi:hypothetical protein
MATLAVVVQETVAVAKIDLPGDSKQGGSHFSYQNWFVCEWT